MDWLDQIMALTQPGAAAKQKTGSGWNQSWNPYGNAGSAESSSPRFTQQYLESITPAFSADLERPGQYPVGMGQGVKARPASPMLPAIPGLNTGTTAAALPNTEALGWTNPLAPQGGMGMPESSPDIFTSLYGNPMGGAPAIGEAGGFSANYLNNPNAAADTGGINNWLTKNAPLLNTIYGGVNMANLVSEMLTGWQSIDMAKDMFRFEKDAWNKNYANQVSDYNRQITDLAAARGGYDPGYDQAGYLKRNLLAGGGV